MKYIIYLNMLVSLEWIVNLKMNIKYCDTKYYFSLFNGPQHIYLHLKDSPEYYEYSFTVCLC